MAVSSGVQSNPGNIPQYATDQQGENMKAAHEKLLIASLAGLILVSAAAFAVSPAHAEGYDVDEKAQVTGVEWWDHLNVRKWPAHYSQKIGAIAPQSWVWVERCIEVENSSDWCKVEVGETYGWVNSRYLTGYDPYADTTYGVE